MGITINSNNFSFDLGYGGFGRFRGKVATLTNPDFGKHYEKLGNAMVLYGVERDAFYKKYNAETKELIKNNVMTVEVANFCYQSDCEGSIDQEQASQIHQKIKDCEDVIAYGYTGKPDCTMFSDLKNLFKDCAENGGTIEWC